ncbi:fumarylacetoacetate hydrolase family protein [Xanthobacter sp. 91]|uniref:2-keto-4-pentenoate hydratase n=1 Tax=Xanthobacter sp. 91 TaxID=1117244 RepID=UPI0004980212|nr:fumarylacetoacetate hydrolase family protein [Xanthobacter sp. 91]
MSPEDAARLAGLLHAARQVGCLVDLPADARLPATPEEAYQVQAEIVRRSGEAILGWKVTALKAEDRAAYGGTRPVAGPLLSGWVFPAPAEVPLSRFIAPLLECEFAFLLGRDLPPRETPYTLEEIADAVAALIPAFEIADGRVPQDLPPDAPGALRLADSMGNGAFIPGTPVTDWRALDRAGPVTLTIDGIEIETGSGARILGDPLKAVQYLANAQPLCAPLCAGQIVTTGTATTPVRLKRAGRVEADFGAVGRVGMG